MKYTRYIKDSFALAGILSIAASFLAILAAIFGAVIIAAAGAFVLLFPLVLLTLAAIRRFAGAYAAKQKAKLEAFIAERDKVKE